MVYREDHAPGGVAIDEALETTDVMVVDEPKADVESNRIWCGYTLHM